MRVFNGRTKAEQDALSLSMMHDAAWVSLHSMPLSLTRLVQQASCRQQKGKGMAWSDSPTDVVRLNSGPCPYPMLVDLLMNVTSPRAVVEGG